VKFSDDKVTIDAKLFNPSRIIKLSGTIARKGPHAADRPHRCSKVISVPDQLQIVTTELLDPKQALYIRGPSGAKSYDSYYQ
jgi:hypothetical protein